MMRKSVRKAVFSTEGKVISKSVGKVTFFTDSKGRYIW